LDFVKSQSGLFERSNYNCSVINCVKDYVSSGAISQMQLNSGKDSFVGLGIDGPGITIKDTKIIVSSNAPASCTPNLYVDLLADDLDVMTSNKGSGESCGIKHIGCYNYLNTGETAIVTGKEYCEKINLPAAPSFILGGNIRKGSGESNLTMRLYNFDSGTIAGNPISIFNGTNSSDIHSDGRIKF